jgi:hypothetical protein
MEPAHLGVNGFLTALPRTFTPSLRGAVGAPVRLTVKIPWVRVRIAFRAQRLCQLGRKPGLSSHSSL